MPERVRGGIGRVALAMLVLAIGVLPLRAAPPAPAPAFDIAAPHVILIEADSGSVLFEKKADEPFAPASLAKLMTAEIVFDALKAGKLTLETEYVVSTNAWKEGGASSGGSTMLANVNSRVKIADLLRGLIIQSGNDSAITIAENMSGSEEAFAKLMNAKARDLGMTHSSFRNATGYSAPGQEVTARDIAKLALHLIETYPEYYPIFGEKVFVWNKIKQQNRNPLLTADIGADGLKTGFLDEAGYSLCGSAVQNGQRLIMVVSGFKTARDRVTDSRKLIEWGFRTFEGREVFAKDETITQVPVFGGEVSSVPVAPSRPVRLLSPRGSADPAKAEVVFTGPVKAPLEAGRRIGTIRFTRKGSVVLEQPVFAAKAVGAGTFTRRAFDAAYEIGAGLIHDAFGKREEAAPAGKDAS